MASEKGFAKDFPTPFDFRVIIREDSHQWILGLARRLLRADAKGKIMHVRMFRLAAAAAGALVLAAAAFGVEVDWRVKGVVTPVKNQGTPSFDASWAFAVTGAVEGYRAINVGSLISLSEQELIDCVPAVGDCADPSCGQAPCGLNFAMTEGLASESSYPYTARQGSCKVSTPVSNIPGWTRLAGESGLITALNSGPVIARLSIGDHGVPIAAWTSYAGGLFPTSASDDTVHQWVLIVGYTDSLFTIKNSIGTTWGESGYVLLPRGSNALGVADDAYAPSSDTAHGACALPGGACQDLTAANCATAGGIYGGDLSFCPASCGTCADDATPPVIHASARPRPAKKGSGTLTLTVAGTATDDCALDRSSGEYWVTDSYDPGAPIVPNPVSIGEDGSFSFPVSLAATRTGKRAHLYKIFVRARDAAGNRATITIAIPIT